VNLPQKSAATRIRMKATTQSKAKIPTRPTKSKVKQPAAKGGRAAKAEATREKLFSCASEIVGKVGYSNTAVALITQKANLAQGTFYNYFESRQDLLDQLLPALGERMLTHIHDSAVGGRNFAELEESSFRAFFTFLEETPSFFTILNEAESFAPKGHKKHFEIVSRRYLRFLGRSLANGEFPGYDKSELETIVYILMAARSYLAIRHGRRNGKKTVIPPEVIDTYMKFVKFGLQGVPAGKHGAASK